MADGPAAPALGPDRDAAAARHFRNGRGEGRVRDRFDAEGYVAANPNLAAAFGAGADAAALHFLRHCWQGARADAWV